MGVLLSIILPLSVPTVVSLTKPIHPLLSKIHYKLVAQPLINEDFINDRLYISLQVIPWRPLDEPLWKSFYRFLFTLIENIILFHLTPSKIRQYDQHIVYQSTTVMESNIAIENLKQTIKYTSNVFNARDIIDSNRDLREIIEKTNLMFQTSFKDDIAADEAKFNVARFLVGQGHALNCKLSRKVELNEKEKMIKRDLDFCVRNVDSLSYGITLFHGFQKYVNYQFVHSEERILTSSNGSATFQSKGLGKRYLQLPGFVAKSPCHSIAVANAYGADRLRPRVLIVTYPPGSKQIHYNVRYKDTEFEYLTHSNERLEVLSEHRIWTNTQMTTYYVCCPA